MTDRLAYPVEIIAKLLKITPRRVQQLANENVVHKTARGQYDLIKSVQGYIEYLNNQIPNKANSGNSQFAAIDLTVEQAKLTKHKAEIERMKELEMKGLLVNKAAEIQYAFKIARITRNNILNLPAQLAITLAAETDADKVYRSLKNALIESLTEIADLAEQAEQQQNAEWPHETECYHWHWSN